ncbi:MAG: hypothetical protein ACR2RL_07185 [Gammaproteobacteria bacterium]
MERELIKNDTGRVLGEITLDGSNFNVYRRERLRFPPRKRRVLVGSCDNLDAARKLAQKLGGTFTPARIADISARVAEA